jgi:hypothetical protein
MGGNNLKGMVYCSEFSTKDVREPWYSSRESNSFMEVINSITSFFSYLGTIFFLFGWFKGPVNVVAILSSRGGGE